MAGVASSSRQRSRIAPYLMILPGLAYLAIFFVVPFFSLFRTSLSSMGGSVYLPKLTFAWDFSNYAQAFSLYHEQIVRSLVYALAATVISLMLGSTSIAPTMLSRSRAEASRAIPRPIGPSP